MKEKRVKMGKFAKLLLIFIVIIVVFKSDIVEGGRSIKISDEKDDDQNFPGVALSNIPYFLNIPKYPNFLGFHFLAQVPLNSFRI